MAGASEANGEERSLMRRFLRGFLYFFAASLLFLVFFFYDPLPENPPAAALSAAAADYDAEIIRDTWGVPHIFGARDADVSFGLAYAHAEDDYETIQEVLAATRGVLARYRGADAAPADYIVEFFDVWDTLEARYDSDVPPHVKAIADAYAAGLNLYAAEHPDDTWAGLVPFKGQDVIAGFMFKTPFFYGLDKTLQELFAPGRNQELALAPTEGQQAFSLGPKTGLELGSNAIAVAARRSTDNVTRLLINSHQPMTGPVAWYEAHLSSGEGLNITGGLFPGTPLILHGFNDHLGWANTVNHMDLSDVYVLTRNPDNPMQYRLDGEWVDFEVEEIELPVKMFGPFVYPAKRRLLRSRHGPVIENGEQTYALRYAGRGEIRQLEQYYRLNKSKTFDQFMSAMAMNALPSINYVYADKSGNVAFIHNGQYPNRLDGWAWTKDLPGDRSELIWQGYLPFESVPKLINPSSGMVFNANNTPYTATDGPDNLEPKEFPAHMGLATNETNRSLRLVELTDGTTPVSRERLLAIKFDDDYSRSSRIARLVEKMAAADYADDPQAAAAAEQLLRWNLSADTGNRYAALPIMALRFHDRENADDESDASLSAALRMAVSYLETHHGRIDPLWGDVSRMVRGDVSLPVDGGPDTLRAIYAAGENGGGTAPATHGDTWIGFVEWAADGSQRADVVHQFGSATLDEKSPHYADQVPLFVEKRWRRALTSREAVLANATRQYRPGK